MKNLKSMISQELYPFQSHYLSLDMGNLHYIDEGEGEIILFIHGTPTWSFLYRNQIKELSKNYRCIAVDHIGFGLSDKPIDWEYTPKQHAQNLAQLIDHLQLEKFTLVVHDFGGPIGLSYAIEHSHKIKNIVMLNTWLWGTKENKDALKVNRILHNPIGKFMYLYLNFSPKILLKSSFHIKNKLTKEIHQQYIKVFPTKNSRYGALKIGHALVGESDWYEEQWNQIEKITKLPFLILWGTKDPFIKMNDLEKWKGKLENYQLELLESGHFVQEEKSSEVTKLIKTFLK